MSLPDIGDAFGNRDLRQSSMRVAPSQRCERRTMTSTATTTCSSRYSKGEQAAHNHGTNCGQMAPSSSAGFCSYFYHGLFCSL